MTSKLSSAKPGGSILVWHETQGEDWRWFVGCVGVGGGAGLSGSTAGTPEGGGDGGVPRMRSSTQAPRVTGEVLVPLAVTFSTLAMVMTPPRWLSGGNATLRNACPSTPGMP